MAPADDECNMACDGNSDQTCGGAWRNEIFTITDTGEQVDIDTEIDVSYIYRGCFIDVGDASGRDMGSGLGNDEGTVTNMASQASAHTCAELCYGYEHFGLQYHTQCFCDNQVKDPRSVMSRCNSSQFFRNRDRTLVFSVRNSRPGHGCAERLQHAVPAPESRRQPWRTDANESDLRGHLDSRMRCGGGSCWRQKA